VSAAGWIAAAVVGGLWYGRHTVVTVVEAPSAPMPAETRVVEHHAVPEMPVVEPHHEPDRVEVLRSGRIMIDRPVARFGVDEFGHDRVSLVGSITKSDRNPPIASVTDGDHNRPERATYAELMRQYFPRSNDFQRGTLSQPQSIDTGDRT
jgi:hypothetical protein